MILIYMNYTILYILVLIVFFLIINLKKKYIEKFRNTNLSNYNRFVRNLQQYKKKKKYVLIFTGGPTLKEFKKKNISKEIYENSYIISVKNTINFLDKIGIKPDFLVSNFESSAKRINTHLLTKYNTINIALNFDKNPKSHNLKKYFKYIINLKNYKKKNLMELVINNKKGLDFENINNKIYTGWGHIMMEIAIPLCIFLETKNIITIGWDNNPKNKYHWDKIENFDNINNGINWSSLDTVCNKFSPYLYDYLWKHYKIKIYKINKKSAMMIPIFK